MPEVTGSLSKHKIVLGMSGGVDSTTAALLLNEKGYEVHGLYFDVRPADRRIGGPDAGRLAAEKVFSEAGCKGKFHYIDASYEFEEKIISNFCSEYSCGRTPNPCILCNPLIKFRLLCETADKVGAYYIATGHYAKVLYDENKCEYHIATAMTKDQSYMLYRLGQDVLSRLILPLGEFTDKENVRNIARAADLSNADAHDSQEICFINDDEDFYDYIADYYRRTGKSVPHTLSPGDFIDKTGKVLGRHKGCAHYTIGQRKGLGIALGKPAFVTDIDAEHNLVVLGDNEELFKRNIKIENVYFCSKFEHYEKNNELYGKIRYAAAPSPCNINSEMAGELLVEFEKPQRAPTPGQSLVLYDGDITLGGGFIK